MKAKLIHRGNGDYKLYVNGATYAQSAPNPHRKLSKQNCDEIFGVVDVEKLFNEVDETIDFHEFCFTSFKLGFNKAIELNKDKKFTEDDMIAFAVKFSQLKNGEFFKGLNELLNEYSKEPTEIEVEIEMEPYRMSDFVEDGNTHLSGVIERPKLDSEGCLKLKKIED
jgi:hypothetical protein